MRMICLAVLSTILVSSCTSFVPAAALPPPVPPVVRDAGPIDATFETAGAEMRWRGRCLPRGWNGTPDLDTARGAGGSNSSLRLTFDFIQDQVASFAIDCSPRDVTGYAGIELDVKGTVKGTAMIGLVTSLPPLRRPSEPGQPEVMPFADVWRESFLFDTEWRHVRMPFSKLFGSRMLMLEGHAKLSDRLWQLDARSVEAVMVGLSGKGDNGNKEGYFWIDNIRFYR